jgi:hypothetical protein
VVSRCDNCGHRTRKLYALERFQGRIPMVCGACLERVVRGIAMVNRAVGGRAA